MAMRYLGDQFDVHTGGIDNAFPHHEDEIAQSAPITGAIPARHWVHGEFLLSDGHKMAKSAGNFQRITEVVEAGFDPLAFRYLTLTSRYGRKLEYSDRSLTAAATALESLRTRLRQLGAPPPDGPWKAPEPLVAGAAGDRPEGIAAGAAGHGDGPPFEVHDRAADPRAPLSAAGRALHDRFVAAIDDDLDMPTAVALLRATLRADLPADERRWLALDADSVLGLDLHRIWATSVEMAGVAPPAEAVELLAERSAARASRDYARSDALRDRLAELGWEVVDEPDASRLRAKERSR
jgi:cysteinyl-tRNA synthetase